VFSLEKFFVTTAIVYPNADPHVGFAFEQVFADVLARYYRLKGSDVLFLSGSDDHGSKIAKYAKEAGKEPKAFVDEQVEKYLRLAKALNLSLSRFIRTTDLDHECTVQEVFQRIFKNKDIYKGTYEGLYCVGCEAFITEKELVDEKCPYHKTVPALLKEENYFFRLSKFKQKIIQLLEKEKFYIPKARANEILNRLKNQELKDLSVSRPKSNVSWGIELPFDDSHTVYVWFDALLNYYTGSKAGKKNYWPADLHIIGKEIAWFHAVIWPAILLSAKIPLPKKVFGHGWLTFEGQKMSKSLGNVIDPFYFCKTYGADSLRYYLCREISFGEDGDFSEKNLIARHNNELANELGNLLSRTLTLLEKGFEGKIPKSQTSQELQKGLHLKKIQQSFESLEINVALSEIFSFISSCNKFINDREPWKQKGKELEKTLYSVVDSLRVISILLSPVIPQTSEKINSQLGVKAGSLKDCKFNLLKTGTQTKKGEILFKKAELQEKSSDKN